MPRLTNATPKYRKHKPTGQAVVTLDGRDFYLGPYGSKASRVEYDRLVSEWLACGRSLAAIAGLSINEVAIRYLQFAQGYYQKNGEPTGTLCGIRLALRYLCTRYGRQPAHDFGPLALAALQQDMIAAGQSRRYVNDNIDCIRRVIKCAVSQELVPQSLHHALMAVPGLRKGRTTAREPVPIGPVAAEVVAATLPHLRPIVADMVRVQRLTGCRPDELCQMRPMDIERKGDVWEYRPQRHKTEHHGRDRVVLIGPKAQAILGPYLVRAGESYCFSPAESEAVHNAERRLARKSPMTPSQSQRRAKRHPKRAPGER